VRADVPGGLSMFFHFVVMKSCASSMGSANHHSSFVHVICECLNGLPAYSYGILSSSNDFVVSMCSRLRDPMTRLWGGPSLVAVQDSHPHWKSSFKDHYESYECG
jgi:hypothetical protein